MTDAQIMAVISRGAERLALLPAGQRDHALAELQAAVRGIARSCGFAEEIGESFAEELVEALRATVAASPTHRHSLH